jgi:hypothetical protein
MAAITRSVLSQEPIDELYRVFHPQKGLLRYVIASYRANKHVHKRRALTILEEC